MNTWKEGSDSWNYVHGSELTDGKMSVREGTGKWDCVYGTERGTQEDVRERELADWKMSI